MNGSATGLTGDRDACTIRVVPLDRFFWEAACVCGWSAVRGAEASAVVAACEHGGWVRLVGRDALTLAVARP